MQSLEKLSTWMSSIVSVGIVRDLRMSFYITVIQRMGIL